MNRHKGIWIILALATIAGSIILLCGDANAATSKYEAETFNSTTAQVVTGLNPAVTSGGELLIFRDAGFATKTVTTSFNIEQVIIKARGGQNCNGWPTLQVSLDGNQILSQQVGQLAWIIYAQPSLANAGSHTLRIDFPNPYSQLGCVRALRVDYVELRGTEPPPPPPSGFRAFASSSIWNTPAANKGTASATNPNASLFTSYDPGLIIGGGPNGSSSHDRDYRKPILEAKAGDPCVPVIEAEPSWVSIASGVKAPACFQLPSGADWAHGSDGHIGIINSDRTQFLQCWRVTQANSSAIKATDCSQWSLTGDGSGPKQGSGVQNCCGSAGGRGSGTPIITTTLTADDALNGFNHALGVTVPNVSSSYIYPPASKSDGSCGCNMKYGQLYVLRADYPVPSNAPTGVRNTIAALKTYGMYVVDQGASFEIDSQGDDAIGTQSKWAQSGIVRTSFNTIRPTDLRLVQ